jgi:LacI family transcriptional regulator
MTARKVSIVDVAKAAGVSPATVDRVLNRRGGVRSDKENLVLAAARALGIDRALERTPTRTLRIAVLIQGPGNPFHASLREGIDLASRMYAALNMQFFVQYIDPQRPAAIASQIRDAHSYNGLIVTSPDDIRVRDAVTSLSRHIPVVTLATDLADCGRAAYIGPDDDKAGRVAGDLMGLFLRPSGGRIMMVAGSRNITGHRDRERGFRAILNERHPSCSLATVIETGEDPEEAGRVVEIAFRTDPGLKGIYHLSSGARAIVKSLERLGRERDTTIITHELTKDRRRLLKERRINAVIDQKPKLEARLAIETIARLLGRLPGTGMSLATDIEIFLPENA